MARVARVVRECWHDPKHALAAVAPIVPVVPVMTLSVSVVCPLQYAAGAGAGTVVPCDQLQEKQHGGDQLLGDSVQSYRPEKSFQAIPGCYKCGSCCG